MSQVLCEVCTFWRKRPDLGEDLGNCKRHSPAPLLVVHRSEESVRLYWPVTPGGESCGDGIPMPRSSPDEN